jgi:four helix bundle suffix protein
MLKNNLPIHIAADDREHKSEVIESLSQIEDVDLTICRLSMGDYRIDHRLVVERKTLKDFAISIIDGRLFKQMIRLANSDSKAVLIIEGIASDIAELGMTRESMQGALITVSLILGIPVLRSKNPSETARLMVYIGRQMESMAIGGVQRHGYRPKGKRKRQLFILQGLPGVGPGRAARLLNHFGSVEAAISASSSEIQSVNGFGQGVADKIRWAVTERVSPYKTYIEGSQPEIAANTLICLVHQTNYLLDQQLRQLEKQFLEQGGFTEKLYSARQKARK